jgi:hypothetical protein
LSDWSRKGLYYTMVELTHTAYASIDAKDPRYLENPRIVRADVLKALAQIKIIHNLLFSFELDEPYITVYKSKGKITIKYRWPQEYNQGDTIYGILRKDEIYETVLGMVMEDAG